MGTPDSILFNPQMIELAETMAYGHLGGDVSTKLGLDRMLLELKFRDYILPVLADLGGFEPLENQYQSDVETIHIWKDAMEKTPLRDTRCVRLTSRGIQMYREDKPVFSVLVFLTRRREWITAISEYQYVEKLDYRPNDWQWPRNFVYHNRLEDMYVWSEQLIKDEGLNRFNDNEESFVTKLSQALDDLLRKAVHRRRETLRKLEEAELSARMQNMRFTGYQYLSSTREYCMQEGLME